MISGQYVWIEGKVTETQPKDFPKRVRVYIAGVGTGIAKNVKPVTEENDSLPRSLHADRGEK